MELELIPKEDGKEIRLLSPEEREAMKKRIRTINPSELAHFGEAERQRIKIFLSRLISLSEHVHHDMEDEEHIAEHREQIEELHGKRQLLFRKADGKIQEFIKLIDLCAAEPWLEYEVFMRRLQGELRKRLFDIKNRVGVEAGLNNPFLMQVDDVKDDEHKELSAATRITEREIEELIFRFPLEDLVKVLIDARKVITGTFWEDDYYDL